MQRIWKKVFPKVSSPGLYCEKKKSFRIDDGNGNDTKEEYDWSTEEK